MFVPGTNFARALRRRQTKEVATLWASLRDRRLDGLKFRRQVPRGPNVVDFICDEAMLIVELDGSQHSEAEIVKSDEISTHYLEALGYKVLRIWNNQVGHNLQTVVDGIFLMAHSRRKSPSSALRAPSPQGEKGKNDKNKRFEEKS